LKTKALAILLLIVMIPLFLLGWLGLRVLRDEQRLHDHQIQSLITSQLQAVDQSITQHFKTLETELPKEAATLAKDPAGVRAFLRGKPGIRQMLIFDSDYHRVFPPGNSPLTRMERRFLERAGAVLSRLESGALDATPSGVTPIPGSGPTRSQSAATVPLEDKRQELQGWHVWYSGAEMNHLFWWRDATRHWIGFELDPVRLQANIIGMLPATGGPDDRLGEARIRLVDSAGTVVYQWGRFEPVDGPAHQLPLSPPLGSWKLEYFGSGLGQGADLKWFNLAGILTAVGAALFGLAFYLYREHSREMQLAEQRVNFVNQVSHELKTPLTNIRLYAELLGENPREDDSEESGKFRRYLEVITSESQRLSRLIANVLNFARLKKERTVLRREAGQVDAIIKAALNMFAPSLEAKGVRIHFQAGAGDRVEVDPDALEQILNNIFSNAEKYGTAGNRLDIQSSRKGDRTVIFVRDYGPGVPKREADRIFQPFYRTHSRITDGVTGTGIGLGIARELARLHGGDLTLVATDEGACFKIELHTPVRPA
jgi:signal transduction histidine kinase